MHRKLKQFFSPGPWLTLLLVVLAALLLSVVLTRGDKSAVAYFSYLFSTYALIVGVRGFVHLLKWLGERIRSSRLSRLLHRNPLVAQYLDDPIYRTQFTLFGNVIINAAYMVSMLSLEAAMIARFGDPSEPLFRAKMIGITGFVICLLVVLLSMLMIIHAAKE